MGNTASDENITSTDPRMTLCAYELKIGALSDIIDQEQLQTDADFAELARLQSPDNNDVAKIERRIRSRATLIATHKYAVHSLCIARDNVHAPVSKYVPPTAQTGPAQPASSVKEWVMSFIATPTKKADAEAEDDEDGDDDETEKQPTTAAQS